MTTRGMLASVSLAANDEDLCFGRVQRKTIRSGPAYDHLGISSYTVEREMKVCRKKVVLKLGVIGKDHHLREKDL